MNKKIRSTTRSGAKGEIVLDEYEQEIERALERGIKQYSAKKRADLMRTAIDMARNTIAKNKSVTFRVNAWDIERLKARALQEGIPYQTLLSSLVHKYVSGRLKESR